MKKIKFILTIFLLFIIYTYVSYLSLIPDKMVLYNSETTNIKKMPGINISETTMTSNENLNSINIEFKLFGKLTLKTINVNKIENIKVVPIGKVVGLKMYTNGVLVVGMSEVENGNNKPYENSNIKPGDTILKINEEIIESIDNLKKIVNDSNGKELNVTILRNGNLIKTNIIPTETLDNKYQLGLWVKDAATGVGTITFYDPKSKFFGVLGHGITDYDTNRLINIASGKLVTAKIISLKKGEENNPGEIKGTIINSQNIGEIKKNTEFGVYGMLNDLTALNIDTSKAIEVASREEIEEGDAKILCSINSSNITKEYKIKIEKIYIENNYNNKSMLIKITDDELLKETGGIIRGLSGAPIIQNGKLIGAITNVLVSNPEIGYGIFADLMINEID